MLYPVSLKGIDCCWSENCITNQIQQYVFDNPLSFNITITVISLFEAGFQLLNQFSFYRADLKSQQGEEATLNWVTLWKDKWWI